LAGRQGVALPSAGPSSMTRPGHSCDQCPERSECLFSTAGLVVDRLHASVAPDMVQKILFFNKFVEEQNRLHHA